MSNHQLFEGFAHRYDLHTPPHHYQHDHQMVLELARQSPSPQRVLDVGCGTGVLLDRLTRAGVEAYGIDLAAGMVDEARSKVDPSRVRQLAMQDLDDRGRYDLIVSLSWCIHYLLDEDELQSTLRRMGEALRPAGQILLQVAHADALPHGWQYDDEAGPDGRPNDIRFGYRFEPAPSGTLKATYSYHCASLGESFTEAHELRFAQLPRVLHAAQSAGLHVIATWGSWRKDPAEGSGSPWVLLRSSAGTG
jgi:SAM-dependent methyltransferase